MQVKGWFINYFLTVNNTTTTTLSVFNMWLLKWLSVCMCNTGRDSLQTGFVWRWQKKKKKTLNYHSNTSNTLEEGSVFCTGQFYFEIINVTWKRPSDGQTKFSKSQDRGRFQRQDLLFSLSTIESKLPRCGCHWFESVKYSDWKVTNPAGHFRLSGEV